MKLPILSVAMLALMVPAGAQAAAFIASFNGTCTSTATATTAKCTDVNGTYGNAVTLNATNDASLQVKMTAWQASQTEQAQGFAAGNYTINNAFLGAYSGGFGVTGRNDSNGANNLHQIDNAAGYTDFVLLQFSRAVHLEGIGVNYYGIGNVYDADASFFNADGLKNTAGTAITSANWNSTINLASGTVAFSPTLAGWSSTATTPDNATGAGSGTRTSTAGGFSQVWLVSASVIATDRDDGFKLALLKVTPQTPPIPEPATWAMMIAGFGAIGATLRRRRAEGALTTA